MGLFYSEQYSIASGIHTAFKAKGNKRILTINHGSEKREKMKSQFPYKKFESFTRENFIITVLYIQFSKSPSSFGKLYKELKTVEKKDVQEFKNKIIYYKKYMKDDIDIIQLEKGNNVDLDYIVGLYREKKIEWFTFYFFILFFSADSLEKVKKSRIDGSLIKSIEKLLLYVTFSEKGMSYIKTLMKDEIKI